MSDGVRQEAATTDVGVFASPTPAELAESGQRNARDGHSPEPPRFVFGYGIKPRYFRITRSTMLTRRSASSRILKTMISWAGQPLAAEP
jgi:hypothetical protein